MWRTVSDAGRAPRAPGDRRRRVALASLIAVICAVYTWYQHGYLLAHAAAPDSLWLWRGAKLLAAGHDPWSAAVWGNAAAFSDSATEVAWRIPLRDPLYYPMPAVLLWVPLAWFPFLTASTLFNAAGAFLFVMAVTRNGLIRAWLCGSIPFMFAMRFGQWSPLICAAWVYPSLASMLVAKPNLGVSLFVARPGRLVTIICLLTLVLPTLVAPWWLSGWMHNIATEMGRTTPHPIPVTMFGGAGSVVLVALLRWRRPEARLLIALACVPQLPYWADQLPLMLIPKERREVLSTLLVTLLGFCAWMVYAPGRGDFVDTIRPFAVVCTFGPALVIVLRRNNVGGLPDAIERHLVPHLPAWIRGSRDSPGAAMPAAGQPVASAL